MAVLSGTRMLDFARRVGFEMRLCRPYRAQTKGKVESGVKYVRGNFWPAVRFRDDDDLNRQALGWCDGIANERVHARLTRYRRRCSPSSAAVLVRCPIALVWACTFVRTARLVETDT